MAYRKSTETSSLKDILARIKGETVAHKPVVYCEADISRAKVVLDRLKRQIGRCEVAYIKPAVCRVEDI